MEHLFYLVIKKETHSFFLPFKVKKKIYYILLFPIWSNSYPFPIVSLKELGDKYIILLTTGLKKIIFLHFFFINYKKNPSNIIFLWILDSRISKFLQNPQNRIRDLDSFVDEAAPGFELGKKDLQSPALPLGHAAKRIHNRKKFCFFGWITKL